MWCCKHWDGEENNYSRAIFEISITQENKRVFARCGKKTLEKNKGSNLQICALFSSGHRRTHFSASHHGAADMQALLSACVSVFACGGCNGRFASGSRCSRLPASVMTTRDDVCDTSGEEGSCREQGWRPLITARWHLNTHTHAITHIHTQI